MAEYSQARTERFGGAHPVFATLRVLEEVIARCGPVAARPDVKVKGSVGVGNWAAAPWIALLDKRVTSTTLTGVYPVLLFREDMTGVYITVAQGTQELKQKGRAHMLGELQRTATRVRGLATTNLKERSFDADNSISLGNGNLARPTIRYTDIVHKLYGASVAVPEDGQIISARS